MRETGSLSVSLKKMTQVLPPKNLRCVALSKKCIFSVAMFTWMWSPGRARLSGLNRAVHRLSFSLASSSSGLWGARRHRTVRGHAAEQFTRLQPTLLEQEWGLRFSELITSGREPTPSTAWRTGGPAESLGG